VDLLERKSSAINMINVKLPDGEVYAFFHLPMTVGTSENFVSQMTEKNRILAVRQVICDLLVNEDGSPFFDDVDQVNPISWNIINAIFDAINQSDREEPGEA